MENPTATFSAVSDLSMDEQVRIWVEQQVRLSHPPFLAITDNETDGEDEEQLPATRRVTTTSGKLRSTDTTVINKVIWPHELIFTLKVSPLLMKASQPWLSLMAISPSCPSKRMPPG